MWQREGGGKQEECRILTPTGLVLELGQDVIGIEEIVSFLEGSVYPIREKNSPMPEAADIRFSLSLFSLSSLLLPRRKSSLKDKDTGGRVSFSVVRFMYSNT